MMVVLIALLVVIAVAGYISSPFFLRDRRLERRYIREELDSVGEQIEQELIELRKNVNDTIEEISTT